MKDTFLKKNNNYKKIIFLLAYFLSICFMFQNAEIIKVNAGSLDMVDKELEQEILKFYIKEDEFLNIMESEIDPYLESIVESGYFTGQEDASIYYEMYKVENSKGSIVISHGYTEGIRKYNELIYYFINMGYSVYGLEHRGHGNSTNLGVKDSTQINVEDFDYYIEDFKTFMDEVVIKNSEDEKLLLFAHSMGGLIGTLFLEEYPEYFDVAILNSPMYKVNTGSIPRWIAKIIAGGATLLWWGDEYVSGQGPYNSDEYNFEESGTTSLPRYEYNFNLRLNNKAYQKSGASYRWLNESFAACSKATRSWNASKIKIPVLLFQAGQDTFVDSSGQDKFAKHAKNCELIRIEESKHECFRENDDILPAYLNNVFSFYENNI